MNTKTNFIKYLFILSLSFGCVLNAQDNKTEKANKKFNNYSFAQAIESYEKLVKEGYSTEEIYKNLGDAYYQKADYNASAYWYKKLFELPDIDIDSEYYYKYAQTLKSNGDYVSSDKWMNKFSEKNSDDIRAFNFTKNKQYLEKISANSKRYVIKNLVINSASADFAPSFFGEQLIFSTARDTGRILRSVHEWNNKPFTNLYSANANEKGNFSTAERLSKKLNKKTHESSTAFSKNGETVYFTRNNSKNGKFARDRNGLSRLKIYRATLKNNEWKDIVELPFNGDNYSVAHPSLSADEKKLYFASDMPGTYGQSDIFVVDINEDGSFGIPKNLGNEINTESRETFPFITSKNVLYFASDGHPGLGGLDIYATKVDDLNAIYIVNVGEPVNSLQDDFSFIIDENTKKGFFTSSRDGGIGSDDIYSFNENEPIVLDCSSVIEGIVVDKENGLPLAGSQVLLFGDDNTIITKTTAGADGEFSVNGSCKKSDYKLKASKEKYESGEKLFSIANTQKITGIEIQLNQIIENPDFGTDLISYLNLAPIHFDLDKSDIRPDAINTLNKVIEFMSKYPNINVEVRSHTDASASDNYNMKLSQRRAKATIAYLISHGVANGKINGIGFGESQLLNDCNTKIKCYDIKHQINRRSEFIVIE
ncbi:OmpA family protein [Maribacter sp. Asnod1-A12]|uniref:OmpA family protein n=1 Tax=Maribacter sp. Asnod1-A12 TaxID=3160576 RepID=UPI0038659F9A